jgi:PKD repeat protein
MKTFFSALFLILALPWGSAAQNAVGRLAVDDCYYLWPFEDYEIRCDVIVFDPDVWGIRVGSGMDPALSPDGKRVVFAANIRPDLFALTDLIVVNLEDGTRTKVTDRGLSPAWSADGQRIAFVTTASTGAFELHVANADGTGLRQITSGTGFRGLPTWSPDGRLAFQCEVETGNFDICSINSDGTGFARLTTFAGNDWQPAFSPDGSRIAFVTDQFTPGEPVMELAILNGDGTVSRLGAGVYGNSPAWSPDGSRIAFGYSDVGGVACQTVCPLGYGHISAVYVDGTGLTGIASGANPSWALSPGGFPPTPQFTAACTALACTFDASESGDDGSIVSFAWRFGDGTTGAGLAPTHVYAAPGSFAVELTVVDDSGARSSVSHTIDVTDGTTLPPVASFTSACNGSTCTFDASSSWDPDGQIASYNWNFGDGTTGGGHQVTHTYAGAGTYNVTLTVTDNYGATSTRTASVTVQAAVLHIGDLDGAKDVHKNSWTASVNIAVHDGGHRAAVNARVNGVWSSGSSGSCTVDSSGTCTIATYIPISKASVTFTVQSVSLGIATYEAARNHDIDGETNGTSITVTRR